MYERIHYVFTTGEVENQTINLLRFDFGKIKRKIPVAYAATF